ncbi:MAG TPA: CrcB family protein [Acidimicrobiales bacterium]|nr:CrcB family protein [Acidimicrobiales bacterium]
MPAPRSGPDQRFPEPAVRVAAIAAGGSLGTLARYGVGRALVPAPLGFPWPTFAVNVAGSFLLGFILVLVVERWPPTRFVRPFAVIGFCGGFTTFSTMAVEIAQRGQHGKVGIAALYLMASLAAGLAAVALGMTVARGGLGRPPGDRSIPDPDDLGVLGPDQIAPP